MLSTSYAAQKCREYRKKNRHNPEYKRRKAASDLRSLLKVRDTQEFRDKRKAITKRYKERKPEAARIFCEATQEWRENNPEKVLAHEAVRKAIRNGLLIRQEHCSNCGVFPPRGQDGRSCIHAHHADYSKPLEVKFLCAFCHGNERRKYK